MTFNKTILSAAILASLAFANQAQAQQQAPAEAQQQDAAAKARAEAAATDPSSVTDLGAITVTGIRNSLQKSLDVKREANSHIEVVTAQDIGKLPAKNVADTLMQVPGVNISSSSASEGGFDESDRVSLRGTSPSLTQTLINGHAVGTGDWFVLSQVQTVGRSVSYSLLPSEIVSQVVVNKSSQAHIVEGGSSGSVDIITRRPLQFADRITGEASIGAVYSDLPSSTKPQFNALFNWKNDAGSAGVMLQGFYEERELQRNGQEVVGGFGKITATVPNPDTVIGGTLPNPLAATNPDLIGALYPNLIGATFFTQTRKRTGGTIDIQIHPSDNLTFGLNAFYSKLEADNFNRNYMLWSSQFANCNAPLPGYSVQDGVLTNAQYGPSPSACPAIPMATTTPYGVYDQISRPKASSSSQYIVLDAQWQVSDRLSINSQMGNTEGSGKSPTQDVMEMGVGGNAGGGWAMNGGSSPIAWNMGNTVNNAPVNILPGSGWIFGGQGIEVKDKELWAQSDAEWFFGTGALTSIQFGARYAEHSRENPFEIAQGPDGTTDWKNPALYPTSHQNYPSGFGNGIGGNFPTNVWYWSPNQLAQINAQFANRDPITRFYWQDVYNVNEQTSAAYAQANFGGERWSGNVGVRYVHTDQVVNNNIAVPTDNPLLQPPGTINGSAFGAYLPNRATKTYDEFLPSGNIKFDLTDDLVIRAAASRTLTRPDYSALSGSVSLDDLTHTGSGGNTDLDPILSTNLDAAIEWYFMPRGLLSASIYSMDLKNYVSFGTSIQPFLDQAATALNGGVPVYVDYNVTSPVNTDAKVKGVEVAYQQPIGEYFGVGANYTYADSEADDGRPVFGTSKNTYNLSAYFENKKFNARLNYTHRSAFFAGVLRSETFYQEEIGTLSAALGYTATDWMTITLDAMNLTSPTLKYTSRVDGKTLPYAFYQNGRQYYLNFRFKF